MQPQPDVPAIVRKSPALQRGRVTAGATPNLAPASGMNARQ
jgi:hypothetical protein